MSYLLRKSTLACFLVACIVSSSANAVDLFQDVANSVGLTYTDTTYGASWADIDNDGRPDLWSGNHNKQPILFRNDPVLGFVPFTNITGLINEDIHGSAFADFDNDGDQDLLIMVGAEVGAGTGPNQLLINDNGSFDEQGAAFDIQYEFARARHLTWFDWNNDGHLDFMLVAQNVRPVPPQAPSRVFTFNPGTGKFEEESWTIHNKNNTTYAQLLLANPALSGTPAVSLNHNKNGFPDIVYSYDAVGLTDSTALFNFPEMNGIRDVALGDYNNDGTTDLLGVGSGNVFLLTQTASGFSDATTGSGLDFDDGLFVVSADFDNDKDLDIYVGRASPANDVNRLNKYFRNDGNNTFTEIAAGNGAEGNLTGFLSSVTVADYNNDGFVDILATNSDNWYLPAVSGPMQLFENQGNSNNWLAIQLVGTLSNRDAIGAVVELTSGATTQIREQNGGMHHRSQNFSRLHFGLGTDTLASSIEVTWPNGTIQTFSNIAPNQLLVIHEDDPGQPNQAPLPTLAALQSGNSLTYDFSSTGSYDPDGIITSYAWDFGDGTSSGEQQPSHIYTMVGTYSITFTVTDNSGVSATTSQSLSVDLKPEIAAAGSTIANAPRAIDELGDGSLDLSTHWTSSGMLAGAWITIDLGSVKTLSGLEVAPRGDRSYELDISIGNTLVGGKVDAPPVSTCEPAPTGSTVPTTTSLCPFTPTAGRYVTIQSTNLANFRLYGVKVLEGSAVNLLPLVNFKAIPQSDSLDLVLNGSASTDPDGTVANYSWTFGDGTTGTGAFITHSYATAGNYTVSLEITDDQNGIRSLDAAVVIVEPTSSQLTATVSAAGSSAGNKDKAIDLTAGGEQNLTSRWTNANSVIEDAWYTLDLGQSVNAGTLKIAPRANSDWVLEITVGDNVDGNGKVTGATPITCNVPVTGGSGTPTFLSDCALGSATGRYISVQSQNRNKLIVHGTQVYATGSSSNQAPVAVPVFNQQLNTLTVDFDATGSTDADGTINSYLWDFGDSTSGSGSTTSNTYADDQERLVSLTVVDNAGAVNAQQSLLAITELPSTPQFVTQPQDQTVEANASATFAVTVVGNNPITYQWRKDGNPISGATGSTYTLALAPVADDGSLFDVIATNAEGSATSSTVTLNVLPENLPPTASFNQDISTGEPPLTVGFDAAASTDSDGTLTEWAWDFGDGGSANGVTASHSFDTVGTFTVTLVVTDDDGATDTTTSTVTTTTPDAPQITAQPQSATATEGSNASFSVSAIGNPPLTYQWYQNGQLVAGATASTFSTLAIASINGDIFTAVVTGPFADVTSDPAVLTVNASPQASFSALPGSGTVPFTVSFDASASTDSDGTIDSYEWDYGDGSSATGVNSTHEYTTSGAFTATLTVTDNNGAQSTTTQPVSANQPPTVVMTLTPSTGAAPLNVVADGTASSDVDGTIVSWDWDFGDGTVGTGAQVSHEFTSGTFSVTLTVTDDDGSTASATQAIFANTPPVAQIAIDKLIDLAPLVINVDATGSSDAENNITTYEWDFGDGNTASGETASNTYNVVGTYVVTLTVTDTSGATGTTSEMVVANAAPIAVFNTNTQLGTAPFDLTLDASGSSDANGTIESFEWDFGDGTLGSGITATHNYATPGAYTIKLTVTDNHGASSSTMQTITANAPPVAAFSLTPSGGLEPLLTTADATASTDSDGSITSYQWDFGDGTTTTGITATHTYNNDGTFVVTLTVVDNNAAANSSQQTVVVDPVVPPAITGQPQSVSAVVGNSALFSVTATGSAPLSYQWQKNDADISGATSSTLTTTGVSIADDGSSYRVFVSNPGGTVQSAAATLSVITSPTITSQPQSLSVAEGMDATFSVTATGSGQLTYQWQRNGLAISGAEAASYTRSAVTLTDDGVLFSVVVSNAAGGSASNSATLNVTPANVAPTASFSESQSGNTLTFDFDASASSDSDGTVTDYNWDFGDGTTGNGVNVTHEYAGEGDYTVELTVVDDDSATNSTQTTLTVTVAQVVVATGADASSQSPEDIIDQLVTGEQDLATFWQNNGSANSAWFTLDLGISRNVNAVLLAPQGNRNYNLSLTVGDSLSNDKVDAPTSGMCTPPQTGSATPTQLQNCPINTTAGRYLTVERTNGSILRVHGAGFTEQTGPGNQAPSAAFTATPLASSRQIDLDATGSSDPDGAIVAWSWDFGDGTSGSGETITHEYDLDGSYSVSLTVTDDAGATDQTSQNVSIDLLSSLLQSPTLIQAVGANTGNAGSINDTQTNGDQQLSSVWDNNSGLSTAWFTLDLGTSQTLVELNLALKGNLQYDLDIVVGEQIDAAGMVVGGTTTLCSTLGDGTSNPTTFTPCSVPYLTGRYVMVKSTNRSNYRVHGVEAWVEDTGQNNIAPSAAFTFTQLANTLSVNFDAANSIDSDGTIDAYAWDFGDGNSATGATPSHVYAVEGSYSVTLTVTDNNNATDTFVLTVDVDPIPVAPQISSQPQSQTATAGDTVGFAVTATGTPAPTYQWQRDGVDISGATQPSLSLTGVTVADSGSVYRVMVANSEGTTTSNDATLTVEAPNADPTAVFTATPLAGAAPLLVSVDGSASSDSDGTISTYAWDFGNGTSTSGSTSSETYSDAGTYTAILTVTDNEGASNSTSQTITVSEAPQPPAITEQPADATVEVGEDVSFSVAATGTNPLSYQWQRDGSDIAGANAANLDVTNVQLADDGAVFGVTITNAAGSVDSTTAVLGVTEPANQNPTASFTATLQPDGLTVDFDAADSTDNDGSITDYAWTFGDGNSTSLATDSTTHSYATAGTYTAELTVTDNQGGTASITAMVTATGTLIPTRQDVTVAAAGGRFSRTPFAIDQLATEEQNLNTYWNSGSAGGLGNAWLTLDLGGSQDIAELHFAPRADRAHSFTVHVGNALTSGQVSNAASAQCDSPDLGSTVKPSSLTVCQIPSSSGRYVTLHSLNQTNVRLYGVEIWALEAGTPPANQPPTAALTATPVGGTLTVDFDASASADSDGTITSYLWTFGDGTTNTTSAAMTSHTYSSDGTYNIAVEVTDDDNATASASDSVTVASGAGGGQLPVTIAAVGNSVNISGRAIDEVANGDQNLSTHWNNGSSGLSKAWITYDLGSEVSVSTLFIAPRADRSFNLDVHLGTSLTGGIVPGAAATTCSTEDQGQNVPSSFSECALPAGSTARYITVRSKNFARLTVYGTEIHD